jgi:hypothetical protein
MYLRSLSRICVCIFVLTSSALCLTLCSNEAAPVKPGFVYMEGKTFMLDGKPMYPMVVNYVLEMGCRNERLWIVPNGDYGDRVAVSRDSSLYYFKADMQMIKDLGFNAVRLTGIGEYKIQDSLITKFADMEKDTVIVLQGKMLENYFAALDDMFKILDEIGIKAIMLAKKQPDPSPAADQHISKLLSRFKNEKAILAWDFFNEPLYFDKPDRKKTEVFEIVRGWKKFARANDPNHLITIGLTGTREVFEWDPNILDVDFLSIHPYEFHKGEVENEVYWYGKYVKKPWIIGETGYSANNDSISYDTQKMYGEKFLKRAINCGASGFSWWQYKDVQWFEYQSNYLGLLNHKGKTQTSDKKLVVNGSPKPVAYIFKDLDPTKRTEECVCRSNYYNYDGQSQYAIKGKVVNKITGKPVKDGPVVAWNQWYGASNLTFTKEDGSFVIYGNYQLYHYIVSATMMDYKRDDIDWEKAPLKTENGVPTFDAGVIKLTPLHLPQ